MESRKNQGNAYAVSFPLWSVIYSTPLTTIGLSQWIEPMRLSDHSRVPSVALRPLIRPLRAKNTTPFATKGEVPELLVYLRTRLGSPVGLMVSCNPADPLPLVTNTQVLLSAGLVHTAG